MVIGYPQASSATCTKTAATGHEIIPGLFIKSLPEGACCLLGDRDTNIDRSFQISDEFACQKASYISGEKSCYTC